MSSDISALNICGLFLYATDNTRNAIAITIPISFIFPGVLGTFRFFEEKSSLPKMKTGSPTGG